jgi:hypothetical protein
MAVSLPSRENQPSLAQISRLYDNLRDLDYGIAVV